MFKACGDEQEPNTSSLSADGPISPTSETLAIDSVVIDEDHQRRRLPNDRAKSPKPLNIAISSNKKRMRRFSCDLCTERFSSHCDLKRHKSSLHEKSSEFMCPIPDCRRSRRGFVRKDNLAAHLRNVHKLQVEQGLLREVVTNEDLDSTTDSSSDAPEEQTSPTPNNQGPTIFEERPASRDERLKFVNQDRRKYKKQKAKIRELEKEVQRLRDRQEAREEQWLGILAKIQST